MTHTYAIRRLLEHGPLTFAELVEITGWERDNLTDVLRHMAKRGTIRRTFAKGCHRFIYRLPHDLSHLHPLGREAHAASDAPAWAGDMRQGSSVAVPAAAIVLPTVRGSTAGDRRSAHRVACEEATC